MINIIFRTNENLPSTLCLDTALSVYMSEDNKIIVESAGDNYISANTITAEDFETLIRTAYVDKAIDLSDENRFGLFDVYEPDEEDETDEFGGLGYDI